MRYQALKHKTYSINPKAQIDIGDESSELFLVPEDGSKIYLHWKNESGKMLATYTMTFPTKVFGKVTLVNALDKTASVRVIW
jgi:hypothetical protein